MIELGAGIGRKGQFLFVFLFIYYMVMENEHGRTVGHLEGEERLVVGPFGNNDQPFEIIFEIIGINLYVAAVETGQEILSHFVREAHFHFFPAVWPRDKAMACQWFGFIGERRGVVKITVVSQPEFLG